MRELEAGQGVHESLDLHAADDRVVDLIENLGRGGETHGELVGDLGALGANDASLLEGGGALLRGHGRCGHITSLSLVGALLTGPSLEERWYQKASVPAFLRF